MEATSMDNTSKIEIPTASEWLPTMPTVGVKVIEMFSDPEIAIVDVAREIKVDPVLTAKLLRIANSPLYRAKSEIVSIEHAVSWIGKSEVAGLVLSLDLARFDSEEPGHQKLFTDYWRQSFIQGCAMSRIAESTGQIPQNEAYACGLLMDLGRLLLLDSNSSGYCQVVEESREKSEPLHQIESNRIGRHHAELGKELLTCMGLPERFATVAGMHVLTKEQLGEVEDLEAFTLLAAAVASSAIGDFYCRANQIESLGTLEFVCRKYLRMSESDIQWLMDAVYDDVQQKAELYSVNVRKMVPMGALIGHTNGQIESQPVAADPNAQLQQEVETLRRLVSNLESKASRDSMTGIFNRDYFTANLTERVSHEKFGCDKFGILVIDIDNFKTINDTHGHISGDFAITWTARRISSFFKNQCVARYGGDEFVGIVDCDNPDELRTRLTELCNEVHAEGAEAANLPEPMSISVGAVFCSLDRPYPSMSSQLFQMADEAMYLAKNSGGNRCHVTELKNDVIDTDTKPVPVVVNDVEGAASICADANTTV